MRSEKAAVSKLALTALTALTTVGISASTGCSNDPPAETAMEMERPPTAVTNPREHVVPFIGSGGFGFRHGSAFPGATAPHGLAKVGPDTRGPFGTVRFLHYSGYWYGDDIVEGFSHLHLHGTGACDYGVLTVMPLSDFSTDKTQPAGYGARMRKDTEVATPGSYAVTLERGDIRSELTATTHAAHHRYRYGAAVPRKSLLFDLAHHLDSGVVTNAEIEVDPAQQRIHGRLHSIGEMSRGYGGYDVFFVARTKTAWTSQSVWSEGVPPAAGTKAMGKGVGVVLFFDSAPTATEPAGPPIELQIGISLVSEENAAKNLAAELPDWDFEKTRERTATEWDKLLTRLRITGGSDAERRMFYSSLYRAFLMPSVHSDVDGRYLGFDGKIKTADGYRYVSDLSLWDTYRTLHPLYSLIAPAAALDAVRSLLAMAQASGAFPKWTLAGGDSGTMIGAPAELVVADAYLKGHTGFDAEAAYQILRAAAADAMPPAGGRGGRNHAETYLQLGYVPAYVGGSVSWTTEYARGDFALGKLAEALGHAQDAQQFAMRSHSYTALYDPAATFLRGRAADGSFPGKNWSPVKYTDDYVEANAWQSLWMNDHDAPGMIQMLGGTDAFVKKLTEMFEASKTQWDQADNTAPSAGVDRPDYYWAGNESDIHAPYLFALAGRPELTQRWVRWLLATQYADSPAGLPGNDDGGTMSAWYVFSALGIFPIAGSDTYVLGTPLFPRIEIAVPGGTFTIEAPGASTARMYVESITLDGVPLTTPTLRHSQLRAGSTLRFVMKQ